MNIQTGFGESHMAEEYIKSMTDIMLPVMEQAVLLAGEYCKACGRDVILPEDMEYAMKYCAMYTVGQQIGTMFPEIYEGEDEDEDIEDVPQEDCPPFVKYTGDDARFIQVNEATERWDSWIPQSPIEQMLKNAINSNE
jgi:histone H3/H4